MKKTTSSRTVSEKGVKRRRNSLGKASRDQIVQAAEQVLKHHGYHTLSTRKVADACGISVGNLTYHFPNKMLLVEAVMSAVCERYMCQRAPIKLKDVNEPLKYLRRTISWMLKDAVEPETSALFLELWVLAKHHYFGTEIIERFYATAIGWITSALKVYFPDAKPEKWERAAYFMLTLSEGSVAVFSRPYQRPVSQKDIVEFAVSGVLAILGEEND